MHPLPTLAREWKAISAFPGWSQAEPESGYSWFDAPLEIAGVTIEGLVLHGGCYPRIPDCHVVMELRVGKWGRHGRIPLIRLEWRSLTGGHRNPRRGSTMWRGRTVSDTHMHPFDMNWIEAEQRMREGNLRMAMDVAEELRSFNDVRSFAGNHFRISNIDIVSPPPWEYTLL